MTMRIPLGYVSPTDMKEVNSLWSLRFYQKKRKNRTWLGGGKNDYSVTN